MRSAHLTSPHLVSSRLTSSRRTSCRHGLAEATDVVISGCSAGAIRVFAHLDALAAMLPPSVRVVGFPDSGFYMDLDIFTPLKHFVVAAAGQVSADI